MQSEFGHQSELNRARQNIAKLEERQNRSFIEELSTAKLVARLEGELQSKDRELVRLEATTNTVARLERELLVSLRLILSRLSCRAVVAKQRPGVGAVRRHCEHGGTVGECVATQGKRALKHRPCAGAVGSQYEHGGTVRE
jgi:hypothetical protein